jgi:hypothetical protein
MRARASALAPDAHLGIWRSDQGFFPSGGTRDWAALLTEQDVDHFHERLRALAGDAYGWIINGRAALIAA